MFSWQISTMSPEFFKMGQPCLFLFIFGLFKPTIQVLQQIYVKNVRPV